MSAPNLPVTYDAVIAGAGPVGLATARDLAQQELRVLVLEEHPKIGEPLHCSGLVSPRTLELAGVTDRVVLNELRGCYVNLDGAEGFEFGASRRKALAIDRVAFDRALYDSARRSGAEVELSSRLVGISRERSRLQLRVRRRQKSDQFISTKLLIGADGAQSFVRRWMGASKEEGQVLSGVSVEARVETTVSDFVQVFVGNNLAPGFFGWLIPLGNRRARIGVATNAGRAPIHYLRRVFASFPHLFSHAEFGSLTGGVIPLRLSKRPFTDNILLVGDAAGQVKPTSGGGIYPGLVAAKHCATIAADCLKSDELSANALGKYHSLWRKDLGREFDRMHELRSAFVGLSDSDFVSAGAVLRTELARHLISKHGDIDYPSHAVGRLAGALPKSTLLLRTALRLPWNRLLGSMSSGGSGDA